MMNKNSVSICFACLLGAFIGTLISIELTQHFNFGQYLWIIGSLVGGSMSYLVYDLKELYRGIKHAYKKVVNWKPDKEWWRNKFIVCLYSSLVFSGIFVWCGIMSYLLSGIFIPIIAPKEFLLAMPDVIRMFLFFPFMIMMFSSLMFIGSITVLNRDDEVLKFVKWLSLRLNILSLPFYILYWTLVGIYFIFVTIPWVYNIVIMTFMPWLCSRVYQFIRTVFLYIHSQERLICLIGASIGATIGFVYGSATIGGVAGAIIGVINYEIISVRILKLLPNK